MDNGLYEIEEKSRLALIFGDGEDRVFATSKSQSTRTYESGRVQKSAVFVKLHLREGHRINSTKVAH